MPSLLYPAWSVLWLACWVPSGMVGVECLVYNEGRVLFTKLYSTARRRHGWVDIRMTDDALVDRNRVGAFAATERSSVAFAATRGFGVVLVVGHGVTHRFRWGGPLGGSPVWTHCIATPRLEPVCSAVSGSSFSPHQQRVVPPCWGSAAGVERGDLVWPG